MIESEKDFFDWLDRQLDDEIPNGIIAFSLNIYESPFKIEIVGSKEFDVEDEDWACNEDWEPGERSIFVSDELFGDSWEDAEESMASMAKSYIYSDSKNASKLRAAKGFAVGFVDGNPTYIWHATNQ